KMIKSNSITHYCHPQAGTAINGVGNNLLNLENTNLVKTPWIIVDYNLQLLDRRAVFFPTVKAYLRAEEVTVVFFFEQKIRYNEVTQICENNLPEILSCRIAEKHSFRGAHLNTS